MNENFKSAVRYIRAAYLDRKQTVFHRIEFDYEHETVLLSSTLNEPVRLDQNLVEFVNAGIIQFVPCGLDTTSHTHAILCQT